MRAARHRHVVVFQSLTDGVDSYGDSTETYSTYAVRYCSVKPLGGREGWNSAQAQTETELRYEFRVRYDVKTKDLTPKHRISYDSRTFDIESVSNVNLMNREVIVIAAERNP